MTKRYAGMSLAAVIGLAALFAVFGLGVSPRDAAAGASDISLTVTTSPATSVKIGETVTVTVAASRAVASPTIYGYTLFLDYDRNSFENPSCDTPKDATQCGLENSGVSGGASFGRTDNINVLPTVNTPVTLVTLKFKAKSEVASSSFVIRAGADFDLLGDGNGDLTSYSTVTNKLGFRVEGVAPTVVSISRSSPTSQMTNASPTFQVVFSRPVAAATANFAIALGSGVTGSSGPSVASLTAVGGSQVNSTTYAATWTFVANLAGAIGTGSVSSDVKASVVPSSSLATSGGTAVVSGTPTSNEWFILDNVAPTATITGPASTNALIKGGTPTFTVTFNEDVDPATVNAADFKIITPAGTPITGLVDGDVASAEASPSGQKKIFNVSINLTSSATDLTAASGDGTASSTFKLGFASGATINDLAGNALTAVSVSSDSAYTLDTVEPTITGSLTSADADSDLDINKSTPTFTITGVSDTGAAPLKTVDLVYRKQSLGRTGDYAVAVSKPGSTTTSTYSFTTPALPDGDYYFKVVATDAAGNATSSTTSDNVYYSIDTSKPVVTWQFANVARNAATPTFDGSFPAIGTVKAGDDIIARMTITDLTGISATTGTFSFTFATSTFALGNVAATGATGTFTLVTPIGSPELGKTSIDATGATTTFTWRIQPPAGTDVNIGATITANLSLYSANDKFGNALVQTSHVGTFYVDNTAPIFSSIVSNASSYYADDVKRFTVYFNENVKGATSSSFDVSKGDSISGTHLLTIGSTCTNAVTVDVSGITGSGSASSTFSLILKGTGTGITDCAGNDLSSARASSATATFTLLSGNRPASQPSSGGGNNDSGSSAPAPSAPAVTVARPPVVVAPPPPAALLAATGGNPAVSQAFASLSPARAQALVAGLRLVPPAAVQGLGAGLSAAGASAAAFLGRVAGLPPVQMAAVATVTGSLPPAASGALVTALSTLSPAQMAAVGEMASVLPPGAANQVFSAIASIAQAGGGSVTFAPPAALSKSADGRDTLTFDLADEAPAAFVADGSEVAGVQSASTSGRTVVFLLKPGQVGRVNRPKSGAWPNLAVPVTAGAQAGLTPIFSLPADATSFTFEPTPGNLNIVQRGSLGGGNVVPLSAPFAVTVSAPAGAAKATVGIQMPSISVAAGDTFAYLYSTGGGTGPGFAGYLRAPAEFDPPTLRQKWTLPIEDATDVLFLPVALRPAYVQNFSADAHIFSSSESDAADFGAAGPQFTTFTVVAPQVGNRIYVFNPVTKGYGWINADEVGPSGAPKD